MKLKYKHHAYEATTWVWLKVCVLEGWFPRRRLLRAGKRVLRRLARWVPVIAVFCLLVSAVFLGMRHIGLIGWPDSVAGMASVMLGSVGVLIIKETFDEERERRSALVFQFRLSSRFERELVVVTRDVFGAAGLPVPGWAVFRSWANVGEFVDEISEKPRDLNVRGAELEEACRNASSLLSWLQIEVSGRTLVDFNPDEGFYRAISEADKQVFAVLVAARTGNAERLVSSACGFMTECVNAFDPLRRPWRYRNDAARRKLLDSYVEAHAVRI